MTGVRQKLFLSIFLLPFVFGMGIVGYWYWTTRIDKKALLPNYGAVPDFSLTSEERRTVSRNDLVGKVTIVDFIFTDCAGTCPMMSTKMAGMQSTLKDASRIQLLSFSVDPETDTPDVLASYAKQYEAIPGKWIFLTGDKATIYALSKEGFHLGLDIEGDNALIHSQKFVLVDYRGDIRGYYDSEDDAAMKNLIRDALILSRTISS